MTTDKHVDPAAAVPVGDEELDGNLQDVPEGAVRFELDRTDIEEALAAPSMQVTSLRHVHAYAYRVPSSTLLFV